MRVLLLNQAFYPDHAATAQHAHDLARDLVQQGHEVHVVASRAIYGQRGAELPRREIVDGIEVHRVGGSLFGKGSTFTRLLDFALFYMLAAVKVLTLPRPDVIVPFSTPPLIVLVGLIEKLLRRSACVYWVMDLHPDVPVAMGIFRPRGLMARLLEAIHRFALRRADRLVVLGRDMRDVVLSKGVAADRITLIRPWADTSELLPQPREGNPFRRAWSLEDKFVVMYSGNLGLAHDARTVADAMVHLAEHPTIRFVFVGGGKRLAELQALVERERLSNVQFHPYQPREQLGASLAAADVHLVSQIPAMTGLLVPSKLFGIMAAQRPAVLIGERECEVGRLLIEHDCGQVVPVGDAAALVRTLSELADQPEQVQAMGKRARAAMVARYDRPHATAAWHRLLSDVVADAAQGVPVEHQ